MKLSLITVSYNSEETIESHLQFCKNAEKGGSILSTSWSMGQYR